MPHKLDTKDLAAIKRLTRLMDNITADSNPAELRGVVAATTEINHLVVSCNNFLVRQDNNLRRAKQFTADVTHELRTPLTILRGETELALRNDRSAEQFREVLESNLEEINRMTFLIEDLLLLSKSDLGEIPLKADSLDFNDLIKELHRKTQLLATDKNIEVQLHCTDEQIVLYADNLRMRQVFLNLLTNAIKYTPDDGTITIDVTATGELVTIAITDTGIGMEEKHLANIFNRFYRINKTDNRYDGGTGLGLSIVKWIVDAHQGSITVTSAPAKGSTFTVTFPQV